MARRSDVIARLDDLLDAKSFPDLGPNGLQVPGREEVHKVVTGVSATRALIEHALERGADLVLVHHGLFWDFEPTGLTPVLAERLRPLMKHDVNLAGYHLPLDAHPELGNNAQLAQAIGIPEHEPFGDFKGRAIGRRGRLAHGPVPIGELVARIGAATEREPLLLPGGDHPVETVGIISGSAASSLAEAAELGLDAFVTGEPREHVMGEAAERGVHFIAAGHYATETFGVRRLGELLEREFGMAHEFASLLNPV
jgi:dinuclear metal center YbgI/SA1388 family protein